jgi:hypothetical protein
MDSIIKSVRRENWLGRETGQKHETFHSIIEMQEVGWSLDDRTMYRKKERAPAA